MSQSDKKKIKGIGIIDLDIQNYRNNVVSNRARFRVIQDKINEIIDYLNAQKSAQKKPPKKPK